MHFAIEEMIAIDNQPISIVENAGFHRLMGKAEARYSMPGRNFMISNIIPVIYTTVRDTVQREVDLAEHVSFTTDIWTE